MDTNMYICIYIYRERERVFMLKAWVLMPRDICCKAAYVDSMGPYLLQQDLNYGPLFCGWLVMVL